MSKIQHYEPTLSWYLVIAIDICKATFLHYFNSNWISFSRAGDCRSHHSKNLIILSMESILLKQVHFNCTHISVAVIIDVNSISLHLIFATTTLSISLGVVIVTIVVVIICSMEIKLISTISTLPILIAIVTYIVINPSINVPMATIPTLLQSRG